MQISLRAYRKAAKLVEVAQIFLDDGAYLTATARLRDAANLIERSGNARMWLMMKTTKKAA